MSLRDKIASLKDIESRIIHVPQWDVKIEVRSMSARDRAAMVQQAADGGGTLNFERLYPDLVIKCAFDPDTGEKAFEEADRDMLLDRHAGAIELIASTAMDVSGMAPKAIDEAGKDSSSTILNDGSISPLPND